MGAVVVVVVASGERVHVSVPSTISVHIDWASTHSSSLHEEQGGVETETKDEARQRKVTVSFSPQMDTTHSSWWLVLVTAGGTRGPPLSSVALHHTRATYATSTIQLSVNKQASKQGESSHELS